MYTQDIGEEDFCKFVAIFKGLTTLFYLRCTCQYNFFCMVLKRPIIFVIVNIIVPIIRI